MRSLLFLLCSLNSLLAQPPSGVNVVASRSTGRLPTTMQATVGELLILDAQSEGAVTWDVPIGVAHHIDQGNHSLILPTFQPGTITISLWVVDAGKAMRAGRCTLVILPLPKPDEPDPEPTPNDLRTQLQAALQADMDAGQGTKLEVAQLAETFELYATAMPEGLETVGSFVTSLSAATPPQLRRHATLPKLHAAIGKHGLAPILGSDANAPFDTSLRTQTAASCSRIAKLLKEIAQ